MSDPGHARARDEARAQRDARVDRIVAMMADGTWTATQARELATEWAIGLGAVQDYAREASGIIRRVVMGEPDDIKAQILAGVEKIRTVAMGKTRTVVTKDGDAVTWADPDCKAALSAFELQAKMLGLIVNKHQDVAPEKLPTADLLAEYERELEAAKAKVN